MWVGTFSYVTPSDYSEGSHLGGRWYCLGILLPGCSSVSDIYLLCIRLDLQVNFLCIVRSVLLHSPSHRLSRRFFAPQSVLTLWRRVSKWAAVGLLAGSRKFSHALVHCSSGASWAWALLPPTPTCRGAPAVRQCLASCLSLLPTVPPNTVILSWVTVQRHSHPFSPASSHSSAPQLPRAVWCLFPPLSRLGEIWPKFRIQFINMKNVEPINVWWTI